MRYFIGIDLGTTNSCVAYIDTEDVKKAVQTLQIPQLISEGTIESLPVLPSFCYLSSDYEWPKGSVELPWQESSRNYFVGAFAQSHGAKVPTRLAMSAKSWLCHAAANRREKILPIEAADETSRVSPIEATSRYLRHIKEAWNATMAKGTIADEFDNQEIVLTVPASFDEVARALTVEAARLAGYSTMTLLEEPQAAFYSWIAQHEQEWESLIPVGSKILVCDVGGGTTDFSLIEVVSNEGKSVFQRMAVGEHLLLGGDNMDAALAYMVEAKLLAKGISSVQHLQLVHEVRRAKEALLQCGKEKRKGASPENYNIVLQGSGSSVVKGTLSTEVTKEEVQDLLLKGFFGECSWEDAVQLKKGSGFRSMGLPYEDEPSVVKQLAHFLKISGEGEPQQPDFILFNGGAVKPLIFQEAITQSLSKWFPKKHIQQLPSYHLDLAVSRGAAYFGKARAGLGVKIGGGIARGYYLVLEMPEEDKIEQKALTLLPRGSEEGSLYEPTNTFFLKPNTPVSFQLCTSHVRLHDTFGDIVDIDPEEMHLLPPIRTVLRFGKKQVSEASVEKIPVHIQIALTTIGTVEINVKSLKTDHKWALEFQVRSVTGQDNSLNQLIAAESGADKRLDQTFHGDYLKEAEVVIRQVFEEESEAIKPNKLMDKLEEVLENPRREWPVSVLRGLADIVLKIPLRRGASQERVCRWWNILGFLMRPGFGYPLDDFRMKEIWKSLLGYYKGTFPSDVLIQLYICYRRISGGMSKGQQMQLAGELLSSLITKKNVMMELKSKGDQYIYSEKVRALASMELIDTALKVRLGQALVARVRSGEADDVDFWALGRIAARQLLYGTIVNVIPREVCEEWVLKILDKQKAIDSRLAILFGQMARKTSHREVNLSKEYLERILKAFEGRGEHHRLSELLLSESQMSVSEQEQAFGDKLPPALSLL